MPESDHKSIEQFLPVWGNFGLSVRTFPIFEPRQPSTNGNASSDCAFSLMGISPLPGSLRGVLLCCGGTRCKSSLQRSALGLDASIFNASACHGLRCRCAAPSDSKGRVAYRFRRRQKEGKGCAVLFGFQRTLEAMKKPPHLSKGKK